MTVPTSQSAWHGWRLFAVLAVAVLCMTALVLALQAQPVEGLRSAIRATARSSFALFLVAFLASSLATLVPGPGPARCSVKGATWAWPSPSPTQYTPC